MDVFPLLKPANAVAGDQIVQKGESSYKLYFIVKGEVSVISPMGDTVAVTLRAGDYFGEGVMTARRRSTSCVAASVCDLLTLDRSDLMNLFARHEDAAQKSEAARASNPRPLPLPAMKVPGRIEAATGWRRAIPPRRSRYATGP